MLIMATPHDSGLIVKECSPALTIKNILVPTLQLIGITSTGHKSFKDLLSGATAFSICTVIKIYRVVLVR